MSRMELEKVLFLLEHQEFRETPARTLDEYLFDILGIGDDIYENVRGEGNQILKMYWENEIKEAILYWGIGSGKSTLASIITTYLLHVLLCMDDPHRAFGLMNDKPIAVVNMGTSSWQAKRVVFTAIVNFLNGSQWFQNFDFEPQSMQINVFKKRRFSRRLDPQQPYLAIYCGNSKETMPVGLNVYAWVVDEFAFFLDTEERSNATDVRDMLRNRQTSRFGMNAGMSMTISSARYENDAMDTLFKNKAPLHGKEVYCTKRATWEMKDRKKMSSKTFDFTAKSDDSGKPIEEWKNIPIDFRSAFSENAEKAMRDFACKPSLALEPFDRDSQIIIRNTNLSREDPIRPDGSFKDWFFCDDKHWRFFHIDLAKTKDACGIVVGHQDGWIDANNEEGRNERYPKIVVDLFQRIVAPEGGEILFSDVRQVLYSLVARGFRIRKGTFDGWQSTDSIQILKKKGIDAEVCSVDRTTEAYDTLKSLLHLGAIDYYRYTVKTKKGETVNIVEREYMSLELIKTKKVDHPEGGSKDVTDALAGMILNVVKNAQNKPGISVG